MNIMNAITNHWLWCLGYKDESFSKIVKIGPGWRALSAGIEYNDNPKQGMIWISSGGLVWL